MSNRLFVLPYLTAILMLTACYSEPLLVRQSMNRMVLPESEGTYAISLAPQSAAGYSVEYPSNMTTADANAGEIQKLTSIGGFNASIGLPQNFDLTFTYENGRVNDDPLGSPTARVKYQVLGDNHLFARQGNWSLAITAAQAYNADNSYYHNITWDGGGNDSRIETWYWYSELGLIAGYRPVYDLLFYGGIFYGDATIHLRVEDDNGVNRDKVKNNIDGANIGMAMIPAVDIALIMELCFTRFQWGNYQDSDLSFGVRFEKRLYF